MTLFPMSRAFAPVACGLALLAGCAQGPVPVPPGLREAGPAEVAACSYITDIQMTPAPMARWWATRRCAAPAPR
jgi:hypothetical protein